MAFFNWSGEEQPSRLPAWHEPALCFQHWDGCLLEEEVSTSLNTLVCERGVKPGEPERAEYRVWSASASAVLVVCPTAQRVSTFIHPKLIGGKRS